MENEEIDLEKIRKIIKSSHDSIDADYQEKLESKFVHFLVLAAKKKGGTIKVTNFLLAINGFDIKANEALEENKFDLIFFGTLENNIFILKENNNSIHIKEYNKPIITNLIPIYILLGLLGLVVLCIGIFLLPIVLVLSIPVILFMAIFKENLKKPLLYIFALLGIVIAVLRYLKIEIF
ncbi:hypothetical protein [Brumimicrobium aurantiacum]|uniref:Uncharacterized protein n=1 Tax=Brumimicrobium aurantiacum TaxID=1737063 RepID=A0A3E1EUF2_9FLAO|nr:hypothetical protein [Brumimicrobium aurantiacum]RFC53187.1 hypothetical protein DXU93_14045 [Brumimicrobium aurantiacum]